jgi:serine/threonine protein kinase
MDYIPSVLRSIGVLTYVLLTGCSPFGGETDQETLLNITQAHLDFPEELFAHISRDAQDFIKALLNKSPRYVISFYQYHTLETLLLSTDSSKHEYYISL